MMATEASTQDDSERLARLTHTLQSSTITFLASSLVHELSQPLTAINAWATACLRLMNEQPVSREKLVERLGLLAQESHRATDIVRAFRRILSRKEPEFAELDVNELLSGVTALLTDEAREAHAKISLVANAALPSVRTDPDLLEMAVFILCRNSMDALKQQTRSRRELVIRSRRSGDRTIAVSIEDTGPGIDDDALDHLFEPVASKKPYGLGLGLALCRTVIDALGGRIWLEDSSTEGTTFIFELPAMSEGEAGAPAA